VIQIHVDLSNLIFDITPDCEPLGVGNVSVASLTSSGSEPDCSEVKASLDFSDASTCPGWCGRGGFQIQNTTDDGNSTEPQYLQNTQQYLQVRIKHYFLI
jgi:hypothetical protein